MKPCDTHNPPVMKPKNEHDYCGCGRKSVASFKGQPCCDRCMRIELRLQDRDERRARFRERRVTVAQQEWLRIIADAWLDARAHGRRYAYISPRQLPVSPAAGPQPHPDSRAIPAVAA